MKNSKYVWVKTGLTFRQAERGIEILDSELPKGIYKAEASMSGWYLKNLSDEFIFPYKIYDLQTNFIDHVMRTWDNTDRNLGILLNGVKGTGKSVTGKMIANCTNLPVILVEHNGDGLVDFLKTIDFPCVMFFDEYEKTFGESSQILTLMDGMFSDVSRKMFILTTNSTRIDDNLISRPSRVRYFKEFSNIPITTIAAYLDDNLNDKSRKAEIIKFINSLKNCTIDIIKAIVDEINMHDCSIKTVQSYMNLTKNPIRKHCYYARNYNNDKSFIDFIVDAKKLGTSGKDRNGYDKDYLNYFDLGMDTMYMDLDKRVPELKVGDYMDDDNYYKILEIQDGCYFKVSCSSDPEDSTEWMYVYIKDTTDEGLYGNITSFLI